MSRYSAELSNGRYIAWGYDRPLSEYFLIEYKSPEEIENEDDDMVFNISSHSTIIPHPETPKQLDYANSEILELMKGYGNAIPEEHKIAVSFDLPF
jgi:hypothetical protein